MQTGKLRQDHLAFQANLYESANPTRRWLHNVRRDWIMRALCRVAPFQPHFLEVGMGCGVYTRWMAARGIVCTIDINESFVATAQRIPNVTARVADITVDCFDPIHDVALCSEVLEHVLDSASALKNIHASLKPGGYLILTTPNSYSTVELTARLLAFKPIVKIARIVYGESVDDLGHINRMTRTQLRAQIVEAGFKVIGEEHIAFYLPLIAEFGGEAGARLCRWLAGWLRGTRFTALLWTQCWVLRRPPAK
jgi:2-polyprenyl-3-methyl-5-hydroxy-6-metoxy-1,4-benzoquinol methylase